MRILYLSPYLPARDGIGNYTCLLASAVAEMGNQFAVVVPRRVLDAPEEVIGSVFDWPIRSASLTKIVTAWSPDVIHIQFAVAAYGGRTLELLRWLRRFRRSHNIPVVVTFHEVSRESALLPVASNILFRQIAAHVEHLIVHTNIARSTLTERAGISAASVSVIPHPRSQPPPSRSTPDDLRRRFGLGDAQVLLAFGFIHVDKGLDDLVEALALLRRSERTLLHGVRLVIAGSVRPRRGIFRLFELRDYLHLAKVLHQIRRSRLEDIVVRTGYVPAGEVQSWFEVAAAVVLPYRRIEQSGVAGLARSFSVTVLPSTAGGLAELYSGSPWLFPPKRPTQLAEKIAIFLSAKASGSFTHVHQSTADDLQVVAATTLSIYRAAITATRP